MLKGLVLHQNEKKNTCNKRRMRSEFKGSNTFSLTLLLSSSRQEFSYFSPRYGTLTSQGEGNTAILFCVLSYDSARRITVALPARVRGRGKPRRPRQHRRCLCERTARVNTAFTQLPPGAGYPHLPASPAEKSPSKSGRGSPETPSGPLAEKFLEAFIVRNSLTGAAEGIFGNICKSPLS